MSLTDSLQQDRHIIVAVDTSTGTVRLRGVADVCTDISCNENTVILADESTRAGLAGLNAGDIVKVEGPVGRPDRIVVLRRVWDELSSPEW